MDSLATLEAVLPEILPTWTLAARLVVCLKAFSPLLFGVNAGGNALTPCAVSGRGQRVLECENNLAFYTTVLPCWSLLAHWSENNPVFDVLETSMFLVVGWSDNNPVFDVSEFFAGAGEPGWLVPKPLTWMVSLLVVVVQELIFAFVAFAASEPLVLMVQAQSVGRGV